MSQAGLTSDVRAIGNKSVIRQDTNPRIVKDENAPGSYILIYSANPNFTDNLFSQLPRLPGASISSVNLSQMMRKKKGCSTTLMKRRRYV
jgi:hypothetical protein